MFSIWIGIAQAGWPSIEIPFYDDDLANVFITDLDGDGVMDLVVDVSEWSGTPTGRIVWLRGPSFADTVELATLAAGEHRLAIVDVDVDGHEDILFADDDLSWVRNLGAGAFEDEVWIVPGLGANALAADDIDNDGDIDAVVTGTDGVSLLEGDGLGGFSPATSVSSDPLLRPALADLDGDDDLDVILSGSALYLADNDAGNIGVPIELAPIVSHEYALADLDGDSDLDLLASTGTFPNPAVWYLNEGGLFGAAQSLLDVQAIAVLAAADIDSDADIDPLFVALDDGYRVLSLDNLGGGVFGEQLALSDFFIGEGGEQITVGDLDGDADLDVVVAATGLYWDNGWAQLWVYTNDSVIDTDRDGLSDETEGTLGTDPNNPDSDGDGVIDGEDLAEDSDPNDPPNDPPEETNESGTSGTGGTSIETPSTGEPDGEKPEIIEGRGTCGCASANGGLSTWLGLALLAFRRRK